MIKKKKERKKNYINNPDLSNVSLKWSEKARLYREIRLKNIETIKSSEELSTNDKNDILKILKIPTTHEQCPEYMIECFIELATRISTRKNFWKYTYLEDMKSEAVETCLKYAHNIKPHEKNNPFGYFSKYIWNAFVQRIKKENKLVKCTFDMTKDQLGSSESYDYKNICKSNIDENDNYFDPGEY